MDIGLCTQNHSNQTDSQEIDKVGIMENILNNPGLSQIAENIFQSLLQRIVENAWQNQV